MFEWSILTDTCGVSIYKCTVLDIFTDSRVADHVSPVFLA
jgi:hypothetical protein